MPEPICVADNVIVPIDAIEMRASRASGPGGQNVNKVSSKVELHVDMALIVGLSSSASQRLRAQTHNRRDSEGRLLVTSQLTRDQLKNLNDAREKVRAIIARALIEPVIRRPTRPSRGSNERRLAEKKRIAGRKAERSRRGDSE